MPIIEKLPDRFSASPATWEIKCIGLLLNLRLRFFKFAWSYRLFNYVAILLGAIAAGVAARHAASRGACDPHPPKLFQAAARHFNRGQPRVFFALGYLGWFVSPWACWHPPPPWSSSPGAGNSLERMARDGS